MKKFLPILCLFVFLGAKAQQDPEFTHYMYNMSVVNPAYATGTPSIVNLGGFYRSQWVGAVGAPKTFSFFSHIPLSAKIETGLSLVSDQIGEGAIKENNLYADFAYLLNLSEKHRLSLGIKAGVTFFDTDFSGFRLESGGPGTDPAFDQELHKTFPNIGAGAYYFTENYYLGFSTPNLLKSKHLAENDGIEGIGGEEIHLYFTGGYVFEINREVKLKPSFLLRTVKGVSPIVDVSANVLYRDRFELGVSYRLEDSFSGLMKVGVLPNLDIGYAYDHTVSNLGEFDSGTHEIFILYRLVFIKGHNKSPRFF
jgi:type IX secretion system PorP/SprF family membrane protein